MTSISFLDMSILIEQSILTQTAQHEKSGPKSPMPSGWDSNAAFAG